MPVRPRKSEDVYDEVLPDGGLVLFHSQRALILTLNPTAALIWECCDGAHDVGDIAAGLREVFPRPGTPNETCDRCSPRCVRPA